MLTGIAHFPSGLFLNSRAAIQAINQEANRQLSMPFLQVRFALRCYREHFSRLLWTDRWLKDAVALCAA